MDLTTSPFEFFDTRSCFGWQLQLLERLLLLNHILPHLWGTVEPCYTTILLSLLPLIAQRLGGEKMSV